MSARILAGSAELVPVDSLLAHPENPRRGNDTMIAESIRRNGFFGAVVAQLSTRRILAGRHRWMAAKAEGLTELPVMFVDVDDAHARRILLADNRATDLAAYDEEALARLLDSIRAEPESFDGTGFDQAAFEAIVASAGDAVLRSASQQTASGQNAEHAAPEFSIVVDCASEQHQSELLDRFSAEGLPCRASRK